MKQIVVDYDEYLELEKVKKQIVNIKKELKNDALVREQTYSPATLSTKIETNIILTSGLQIVLEEIGNETSK